MLGCDLCNFVVFVGLCVESLDDLAELVVPLFADVENKNVEVPEWLDHPYGPDEVKVSMAVIHSF